MSAARLNDLFSPERLRQHWLEPAKPEPETPHQARNQAIHQHYQDLQGLIVETFADTARLSVFFDGLTESLHQIFPLDAVTAADENQKQLFIEKLEELDELLWALGLST
jgi:hypothetical protein